MAEQGSARVHLQDVAGALSAPALRHKKCVEHLRARAVGFSFHLVTRAPEVGSAGQCSTSLEANGCSFIAWKI